LYSIIADVCIINIIYYDERTLVRCYNLCPIQNIYRLIHGHFHIGLVIIPRRSWGMKTRPIWKCPCIKLFITYFRHLEKRHPYWPETKSRPILARAIWASTWKWSCSNPITGYFPGVWKYGQFTSGYIGHTKMSLFELSM
jgi:hypothetical protein